jgi:hypothetical protein
MRSNHLSYLAGYPLVPPLISVIGPKPIILADANIIFISLGVRIEFKILTGIKIPHPGT